jgi:hypothetical protein
MRCFIICTLANTIRVIKLRRMTQAGHVACVGKMRMCIKFWSQNLKGRDCMKTKHTWMDNIRMDLEEKRYEGVNWIHLAQHRDQQWALVNKIMNLQVL